jgi:ABC transporter
VGSLGLLRVENWPLRKVSLIYCPGEAWGAIDESDAGKASLLGILLGLLELTEGAITLEEEPWSPLPKSQRQTRRHRVQALFQDGLECLPPHRIGCDTLQAPRLSGGRVTPVPAGRRRCARPSGEVSTGLAWQAALGLVRWPGPAAVPGARPHAGACPAGPGRTLPVLDPTLGGRLLALKVAGSP